jgi:hypothetical protein
MADNKKSFVLYADIIHTISILDDATAGQLFKHILDYVNDKDPISDNMLVNISFEPIKQQLKRDLQKWDEIRSKRAEAGSIGGHSKAKRSKTKQSVANAKSAKQSVANVAVNVNDNVNVNVINNIPTIEEVIDYFRFNGYTRSSAEKAFNYYNENNWKDSQGRKVISWKQKMQGVWFKDENKDKAKEKPVIW